MRLGAIYRESQGTGRGVSIAHQEPFGGFLSGGHFGGGPAGAARPRARMPVA